MHRTYEMEVRDCCAVVLLLCLNSFPVFIDWKEVYSDEEPRKESFFLSWLIYGFMTNLIFKGAASEISHLGIFPDLCPGFKQTLGSEDLWELEETDDAEFNYRQFRVHFDTDVKRWRYVFCSSPVSFFLLTSLQRCRRRKDENVKEAIHGHCAGESACWPLHLLAVLAGAVLGQPDRTARVDAALHSVPARVGPVRRRPRRYPPPRSQWDSD